MLTLYKPPVEGKEKPRQQLPVHQPVTIKWFFQKKTKKKLTVEIKDKTYIHLNKSTHSPLFNSFHQVVCNNE